MASSCQYGQQHFEDPKLAAEAIIERVGRSIVLALPLGLGKANHIANALFDRATADPGISLKILTALTLEPPVAGSDLEGRFLEPLADRYFAGYPPLRYSKALRDGTLPPNIEVHEFFLLPGRWLGNPLVQQNYQSLNYTHVLPFLLRSDFNVLAQLVAPSAGENGDRFSLSCNPDLSVDLLDARKRGEIHFLAVGEVNRALPFMAGAGNRPGADFDLLLDGDEVQFPLLTFPHEPVSLVDHAIGLHVARLIPDGGTLQIGIGSTGDAVIHALLLRHQDNCSFRSLLAALGVDQIGPLCCAEPFSTGLYAASEMLVEGFLHLLERGILKREVDGVVLHAGFFLGSPLFYRTLDRLPAEVRSKIAMMPISFINQLYGQEEAKRRARTDARFINNAIMTTLLGGVVSDGLEDGQVISGVGGQYNFVAMAFALDGARSIITLPATRTSGGRTRSNICWSYGHVTIPRHLRDIVVTEYGIADLRGRSDGDVIAEMLGITDTRFQDELLDQAKESGKIAADYKIPSRQRRNTFERLAEDLRLAREAGHLPPFPLGSEFTPAEERLAPALKTLGEHGGARQALARLALRGLLRRQVGEATRASLDRMGLEPPKTLRDRFYRALLLGVLE